MTALGTEIAQGALEGDRGALSRLPEATQAALRAAVEADLESHRSKDGGYTAK